MDQKLTIDFNKYADGLVPAIIQDHTTRQVLMLGFMNDEALALTKSSGKVTFFSRSKNRLWTKGETSGNFLELRNISVDCDNDSLLIFVDPVGPVCHTGSFSCFGEKSAEEFFPNQLEAIIEERISGPNENSYTSKLVSKGIHKVAQKVGEEAVELVIEAMKKDDELFLNEAADLLFHYTILLKTKGFSFDDVTALLKARHLSKK